MTPPEPQKQLFSTPAVTLAAILSMTSWGFPSIHTLHVVVPFSSVAQVLFIILGSKPPCLHRECVLGITILNLEENQPPQNGKMAIFPQLSNPELRDIRLILSITYLI